MIPVETERFEQLVGEALDLIPDALSARMENVVVQVAEGRDDSSLLGLYEGIPLTEREAYGQGMNLPDRIQIFRRPICAIAHSEADVIDQIRITVIHEVAHHFGIDDNRLAELGWD